jgi:hypothetical protein
MPGSVMAPRAWSRTFPAIPARAGDARRFLARLLGSRAGAGDAAVCLGELAGSASLPSRSRDGRYFTVRAQRTEEGMSLSLPYVPRRVVIKITDSSPASGQGAARPGSAAVPALATLKQPPPDGEGGQALELRQRGIATGCACG